MPRKTGDDYPVQLIDGWMAHKHGLARERCPYSGMTQFASHELWVEGWTARRYADKRNEDLSMDDFVPRAML